MIPQQPLPESYRHPIGQSPDNAGVRILLFGPGELWSDAPPSGRRSTQPKAFALLVRLALSRRSEFVRRDVLLALLWPELGAAKGRNALSQAMHRLRRDVGMDILVTTKNEEVGLAPFVRCDVCTFWEELLEDRLTTALAMYRGPLLEGFHVSNAGNFEHWLDVQRSSLRHDAVHAALALAGRAEEAGRRFEASCWLRRALEIAPDDGITLRRLIRTLVDLGDRAGAIRAYESVEARLWVELELAPDAETNTLVNSLRRTPRSVDPAARRAIVRGRYLSGIPDMFESALASFHRAIELDPDCAEGYAGLAQCLATLSLGGHVSRDEAAGPLDSAARRAIELDDSLPDPHVAVGVGHLVFSRDWSGAERAFRRAVALDPLSATARARLAFFLANMGWFAEATDQAARAAELEPLDPLTSFVHGFVLYRARRYAASAAELHALIELHPRHALAHMFIAENELALGRSDAAIARANIASALLPDDPLIIGISACILGFSGDRSTAAALLDRLRNLNAKRYVNPHFLACAHAGLGELDEAFAHWQTLVTEGEPGAFLLRTDPLFDPLRTDPRFTALLDHLCFPVVDPPPRNSNTGRPTIELA